MTREHQIEGSMIGKVFEGFLAREKIVRLSQSVVATEKEVAAIFRERERLATHSEIPRE
jgi:hypothetical protein